MNEKAVVLMATYNGAKYLREQIDSILNQTYNNILLVIRDDMSTDDTINIINEYKMNNDNIFLIETSRKLGYPACFYDLTDKAPEASYYFFADQDDVWHPKKVERAINVLNNIKESCKVYYSDYWICDDELNKISRSPNVKRDYKLFNSIFETCGIEFTMCLDKKALDLLNMYKPPKLDCRGIWMSMLFSAKARIVYDKVATAKWRRHRSTVTQNEMSDWGLLKYRIKTFIKNDGLNKYRSYICEFKDVVYFDLLEKDKKVIDIFSNTNYLFAYRKIFYPHRLRSNIKDEIMLRGMFILGRL